MRSESITSKINVECNIHTPDTSGRRCLICGKEIGGKKWKNIID